MNLLNGKFLEAVLVLYSVTSAEAFFFHLFGFPRPNFEIFHPRGVTVWYPKLQRIVGFEIKIYLNKPYFSEDMLCDIYLDTSAVSYGKFIVKDDDAYIRPGDNLKYKVNLHYYDGCKHAMRGEFTVTDESSWKSIPREVLHVLRIIHNGLYTLIMRNPIFRLNESSNCTMETKSAEVVKLQEEINLLESIVHDQIQSSGNGSIVSNNLFLNHRPASVILDSDQLYNHTLEMLQEVKPKVNWKIVLVKAFYYNDGVGFEVKTLLDKLKILQMFKNFDQFTVIDMDRIGEVGIDDDYNDENSPIMFHRRGN